MIGAICSKNNSRRTLNGWGAYMSDIEGNSVEETEEVGASTTEERDGKEQGSAIEQKPEKKYTDADVDRIVSKRLNREREKLSKALGEGQKESENRNSEWERKPRRSWTREEAATQLDSTGSGDG